MLDGRRIVHSSDLTVGGAGEMLRLSPPIRIVSALFTNGSFDYKFPSPAAPRVLSAW
jgi:hypothetical protein